MTITDDGNNDKREFSTTEYKLVGPNGNTWTFKDTGKLALNVLEANDINIGGSDLIASGDFDSKVWDTSGSNESTSSSSYANYAINQFQADLLWDTLINGQGAVWFSANANPRGDQIDLRVFNNTDNETMAEVTGTTGSSAQQITTGPTNYTPSTKGSPIDVRIQFRNSDNTTSVDVFRWSVAIGVSV